MSLNRVPRTAPDVILPAHIIQALEAIRLEKTTQYTEIPYAPTYGAQYGKMERRIIIGAIHGINRDPSIAREAYRVLVYDIGISKPTIKLWREKYLEEDGTFSQYTIPPEERARRRANRRRLRSDQ